MWGFLGTVLSIISALFVWGEVGLEAFRQFAPGKQDAPSASEAFQPNVCAEAGDGPFIGAARVLFAEAQTVMEAQIEKHRGGW